MATVSIDKIFEHFGGVGALADKLGVTRQALYQWRSGIPRSRAFEIQVLSGGKFPVKDLPIADGPASRRAA